MRLRNTDPLVVRGHLPACPEIVKGCDIPGNYCDIPGNYWDISGKSNYVKLWDLGLILLTPQLGPKPIIFRAKGRRNEVIW